MVADDPVKIELKTFHPRVINCHEALKQEQDGYKQIPVIRKVDKATVQRNYLQIKQDDEAKLFNASLNKKMARAYFFVCTSFLVSDLT